mgnify:FL=1|jgi:hypothetical protein|tara:strand:+ start:2313 stop:3023 length:711 start_codon:yes stop_codon:yes gene_type:complete
MDTQKTKEPVSLITERYPYKDVKRKTVNGKRHYEGEGKLLPSVTTIISATKAEKDKEGLRAWRNRVGEETAEAVKNQAAAVGTAMHKFLECHIQGIGYDDMTNIGVIGKRMAKLIIECGLPSVDEYWGTEVPLFYPTFYGGTADCTAVWRDQPAIIDFKQTNKPKKDEWIEDYYIQLAAYMMAHDALYKTKMEAGVILMASRGMTLQMFTINGSRLDDYKYKWLKRCEGYYNGHTT